MSERTACMMEFLDYRLGALVTTNVGAAVANNLMANAASVLHLLVSIGQVGVAVVTIWYVAKKIRNLPIKKDKDDSSQG